MTSARRIVEWALAAVGVGICVGATLVFWRSQPYDVWPFPAFYFIEIIVLGVAAFVGLIAPTAGANRWDNLPWAATGALLAFVILGAWTIGPLLLPAMLAFLIAAVVGNAGSNSRWIRRLGILAIAGLGQASLMLVVILLQSRS